jgi:catechol 2,3-dioxygenase-like lactoylglutathione lyase family enzyme
MDRAPEANNGFGLKRIGQIGVNVRDLDRAVAFYRDNLGMRLLFRTPALAFFNCNGVRLMLSLPEQASFDHPSSILYFTVDDLRMAYRTLAARGVPFIDEPHLIAKMPDHELWMAFFTDTEGNTHGLMCEVRE